MKGEPVWGGGPCCAAGFLPGRQPRGDAQQEARPTNSSRSSGANTRWAEIVGKCHRAKDSEAFRKNGMVSGIV